MKNTVYSIGFKSFLFLLAIGLIVQSWEKGTTENPNCLAIVVPDTLRFNFVDKNTGEDLFFSTTPLYTTSQIHFLVDDMQANVNPKIETIATLGNILR